MQSPTHKLHKQSFLAKFGACVVLLAAVPAGYAQSTWTGAVDSNYSNPDNWDPAEVPGTGADVLIDTSTPNEVDIPSGNWDRRGAGTTTISGTGVVNLALGSARLLNTGVFNMSGGALNQIGEYFIVGAGAVGTFNQTGGTVHATLGRGFQLSDNNINQAGTTYNLSGGTLTVNSEATWSDAHLRGVWLGKGGEAGAEGSVAIDPDAVGDTFNVTGGTATFTHTGTNSSEFRISRNAGLIIDGGTVNINDYTSIRVGQGGSGGLHSRIVLESGTLNITGATPLLLGQQDNGTLTINDGVLNLEGFLVLGGDLSGDFDGMGIVNMTGGSLFAGGITLGNEENGSVFNFSGGTITLQGNQTSIIAQSWFSGVEGTFATYDALNDITVIAVVPEPATVVMVLAGLLGMFVVARRRTAATR